MVIRWALVRGVVAGNALIRGPIIGSALTRNTTLQWTTRSIDLG
jgi:hypothetical protein